MKGHGAPDAAFRYTERYDPSLMSLKAFHIVFIAVSTLLCVGFGVWAIAEYRSYGGSGTLVAGVVSLSASLALVWYGRWFLRQLKGVSYL